MIVYNMTDLNVFSPHVCARVRRLLTKMILYGNIGVASARRNNNNYLYYYYYNAMCATP